MIPGSFCLRREIAHIIDFLYWANRGSRSFANLGATKYIISVNAYRDIIDMYSGSGCLAEAMIRAAYIRSSYISAANVLLVDIKPRHLLSTAFSRGIVRALPHLRSKHLHLYIKADSNASEDERKLAEALNTLLSYLEKLDNSIVPMERFSETMSMDTYFLRYLAEQGLVRVYLEPAETFLTRIKRSKAKKRFRSTGPFLIDPPWRESRHDRYAGRKPDYVSVIKELARHEAFIVYIDYRSSIEEILGELPNNYGIIGRYRLYSTNYGGLRTSNDAAFIVALYPHFAERSVNLLESKEKIYFAREKHPHLWKKNFLSAYTRFKHSKLHVRELFGFKEKRIYEACKKLPPRDVWYNIKKPVSIF